MDRKSKIEYKRKKIKDDIKLLEAKLEKQAYKKSLDAGKFSKHVVIFCLGFTAFFAMLCLVVQYKTGYETYPLLRIVAAVFGIELIALMYKRITSTDDDKIATFVSKFKNKIKNLNIGKQTNNSEDIATSTRSNLSDDIKDAAREINQSINGGLG